MPLLDDIEQTWENLEEEIETDAGDFKKWWESLFTQAAAPKAAAVPVPSGTPQEQTISLLQTIATGIGQNGAYLERIATALAPVSKKYYEGALTSDWSQSSKSYFQFTLPVNHFIAINDSTTDDMLFSFDGQNLEGRIKVGEYLPFNFFPSFRQIYFKCADTTAIVRLWIW